MSAIDVFGEIGRTFLGVALVIWSGIAARDVMSARARAGKGLAGLGAYIVLVAVCAALLLAQWVPNGRAFPTGCAVLALLIDLAAAYVWHRRWQATRTVQPGVQR